MQYPSCTGDKYSISSCRVQHTRSNENFFLHYLNSHQLQQQSTIYYDSSYLINHQNSIDEDVSRACVAVNHVCLRGDLHELLPSSISLIPPTLHVAKATHK